MVIRNRTLTTSGRGGQKKKGAVFIPDLAFEAFEFL